MKSSIVLRASTQGLRCAMLCAAAAAATTVSVDIGTTYQTIRGYGSSSAWNSGSFSGANASNATILWANDTLNGHAGLTMLRTRIDPSGSFASEADPMTAAKKTYPDILIWSTEWSPPAAYKNNNNVNGDASNNTFNNTAANSTAYANYLVNYVKSIKSSYGVDLWGISPQNEPDWNTTYESCIWTAAQFDDFIKNYMGPAFKTAGLAAKIIMPESLNDNLSMSATTMADAAAKAYVSVIGGHLYGAGPNLLPSSYGNVEHWATEYSYGSGTSPDNTMSASSGGLQQASLIHKGMVSANLNAYLHWWTVWSDNTGLISGTTPSKKLFVMGNYSKFVRPGYVRISATETPANGVSVSAYYSSTDNRVVVVAINSNNSNVSQAFSVGSKFNVAKVTPWVTDPSNDLVRQAPISQTGGSFTYTLSAQSVTSFVVNGPGTTAVQPIATAVPANIKVDRRDGVEWISLPSSESGVLRVLSLDGRELESQAIPSGSSQIRVGPRAPGVYSVEVKQGSHLVTAKFTEP